MQAHPGQPGSFRLVAGDPVAQDAAPLELERRPPGLHHPRRAVEADIGGRDRAVQPGSRAGHPVPLPWQHDPQSLGPRPRLTAETVESPVLSNGHAGFGERPGETDQEQSRHRAPGRLNPGIWWRLSEGWTGFVADAWG